ncbi:MAG: hypothetical protein H6581_14635 [Bacteroidia bacterium]|nr:hypothetical protein [Bacteroidia bacterium]
MHKLTPESHILSQITRFSFQGRVLLCFMLALFPVWGFSQVNYAVSPEGYVCKGNGAIRVKVENQAGGRLIGSSVSFVVSKTTDQCDFGGSFNQKGKVEIREGRIDGPTIWEQPYQEGMTDLVVSHPLNFSSGEKTYFAVIVSKANLFWDGPIQIKATGEKFATLSQGRISNPSPLPGQKVTFSVTYTDAGNNPPDLFASRVFVLWPGRQEWSAYSLSTSSTEYTDGAEFTSGPLNVRSTGEGEGRYRFEFRDQNGNEVPGSEEEFYFEAGKENLAPRLASPSISPSEPQMGQEVEFSAIYQDEEGDAPQNGATVEVLWPGESVWNTYDLAPAGDDYLTGVRFSTTTLPTEGRKAGQGKFRFNVRENSGKPARRSGEEFAFQLKEINYPPQLSNFSTVPLVAVFGETVTFSLTYTDRNGDPARDGTVFVHWPGQTEVQAYALSTEGADFRGGANFRSQEIKVQGDPPGQAEYWFEFSDENGAEAPENRRKFTLELNSIPELSEANASPNPAPLGGEITFSVRFTDRDGTVPASGAVRVTWPGKGTPQTYSMSVVGNEKDGKALFSSDPLRIPGDQEGLAQYSFEFSDAKGAPARGNEVVHEVEIKRINTPAFLSEALMDPLSPQPGATVTFSITYTDLENDPPSELMGRVFVTWPGFPRETSHPLTTLDGDFRDGSRFNSGLVRVKSTTAGTIRYRFEFQDEAGNFIQEGGSGNFVTTEGPGTVGQGAGAVYEQEKQRDKDQPLLSEPDLNPDPARLGGKVYFSIRYQDEQGEAPQDNPTVKVRWPGQGGWLLFPMKGESVDYEGGVTFRSSAVEVPADKTGTGLFSFHFADINGKEALYSGEEYTFSVSETNRPPRLTHPRLEPNPGNVGDEITFSVVYTDYDNDAPDDRFREVRVLWPGADAWVSYPLSLSEGDYFSGATFSSGPVMVQGPEPGTAQYEFIFADPSEAEAEGSGIMRYFVVEKNNRAPQLSAARVSESEVKNGESVSFSVTYYDPENTQPQEAEVAILWPGSSNWENYPLVKAAKSYSKGVPLVTDKVKVFGREAGEAQVRFNVTDGEGKTYQGEQQILTFRIRKVNEDPALSNPGVEAKRNKAGEAAIFRVTYSDPEGDKAGKAQVLVLWPGGSTWEPHDMKGGKGKPTSGQDFATTPLLYEGTQGGLASYKFEFTDEAGNVAGSSGTVFQFEVSPGTGAVVNPNLTQSNPRVEHPTLLHSKSQEIELDGQIWMEFETQYVDPQGLGPAAKSAQVRWPGKQDWQEYLLEPQGDDFKQGVKFSTGSIAIPSGATGTGAVKFILKDNGGGEVKGSGDALAFTVAAPSRKPGLSGAEASPNTVVPGKKMRFSVVYTDPDNKAPRWGTNRVRVMWPGYDDWTYYALEADGQFFSEGVQYLSPAIEVKSAAEGEGKYQFLFETPDGQPARGEDQEHTFAIALNRMDFPYLNAPKDGQKGLQAPIEFAWEGIEGADRYQIQVSTDRESWSPERGFGKFIYMDQVALEPSYIWYGQLIPGATYYWSVRTFGGENAPSEFSSPRKFRVE